MAHNGLKRSMERGNHSSLQNSSIQVKDLTVAVADGAPGFGTAVIAGLPAGNILFLGAVSYLQFLTADADITTTFDGDYAIGTVATADGNVSDANEADIIPSTALGAATAKLSPVVRGVSTDALGGLIIDNTAGTLNLNLNLLIDDAAISGAANFTANGVIHLAYLVMGDD
jgi:hypothetical protein